MCYTCTSKTKTKKTLGTVGHYSTVQNSIVQYNAIQYITVRNDIVRYGIVQNSVLCT